MDTQILVLNIKIMVQKILNISYLFGKSPFLENTQNYI